MAEWLPQIVMLVTDATCTPVRTSTGCSGPSILDPAGPIADSNRAILLDALGIMLVIVVPTIIGALWFAWWFRASNDNARYRALKAERSAAAAAPSPNNPAGYS